MLGLEDRVLGLDLVSLVLVDNSVDLVRLALPVALGKFLILITL